VCYRKKILLAFFNRSSMLLVQAVNGCVLMHPLSIMYTFTEQVSSLKSCRRPIANTLPCTVLSTAAHTRHASINRSCRDIAYCILQSSVCKVHEKKTDAGNNESYLYNDIRCVTYAPATIPKKPVTSSVHILAIP